MCVCSCMYSCTHASQAISLSFIYFLKILLEIIRFENKDSSKTHPHQPSPRINIYQPAIWISPPLSRLFQVSWTEDPSLPGPTSCHTEPHCSSFHPMTLETVCPQYMGGSNFLLFLNSRFLSYNLLLSMCNSFPISYAHFPNNRKDPFNRMELRMLVQYLPRLMYCSLYIIIIMHSWTGKSILIHIFCQLFIDILLFYDYYLLVLIYGPMNEQQRPTTAPGNHTQLLIS